MKDLVQEVRFIQLLRTNYCDSCDWRSHTHLGYLLNWFRTFHTYVNQPVSEWIVCSAQIYCCITCFLCPMSSSFLDYSFILVEHFLHFLRKGAQEVNILKGRGLKISLSYIWLWLIKNSRLEIDLKTHIHLSYMYTPSACTQPYILAMRHKWHFILRFWLSTLKT